MAQTLSKAQTTAICTRIQEQFRDLPEHLRAYTRCVMRLTMNMEDDDPTPYIEDWFQAIPKTHPWSPYFESPEGDNDVGGLFEEIALAQALHYISR